MKQELRQHLTPVILVFFLVSLFWIIKGVAPFQFIYLFFGLAWGAFILDLDHLIYWFYLKPSLEESRLAQFALKNKDFSSLIKLLESTHKNHTSLIFHHYFFQIILALISIFVFTSSDSVFAKSFLLAINIHLLVDQIHDFRHQPKHLQKWLFARERHQLSLKYLPHYLTIFITLTLVFLLLLINSR